METGPSLYGWVGTKRDPCLPSALAGKPQIITRHGEDVVIVATKQYIETVMRRASIAEFFAESPLAGVDLAIDRNRSSTRSVDLNAVAPQDTRT
jgi:hypothetical protein